jgi:NAD-dependent SIR2 family protein deacetylase
LYDNLQLYNLPYAEAIFDIDFFRHNPYPFVQLASELWPGKANGPVPTLTHIFFQLLEQKKLLKRIYTQNIDGLEYLANVDEDYIIECHGHFRTASCIKCKQATKNIESVRQLIVVDKMVPLCPRCEKPIAGRSTNSNNTGVIVGETESQHAAEREKKNNTTKRQHQHQLNSKRGYIKPDIVFFGEGLPDRFHTVLRNDIHSGLIDCCLIIGTSLQVAPVNQIPSMIYNKSSTNKKKCKRILFNKEYVGGANNIDLHHLGDCDETISTICELLGWKEELVNQHSAAVRAIRK